MTTNSDGRITAHFTLKEFTKTAHASYAQNKPSTPALENIGRVARYLEVVRASIGDKPIILTSGYRSPSVNRAVNGATSSAHLFGLAADFYCPYISSYELIKSAYRAFTHPKHGLVFDQLILEGPVVHLGLSVAKGRGEVLLRTGSGGKWRYSPLHL